MTTTVTITVDPNELAKFKKDGYKLCIARMVENTYSAIWDAQLPAAYTPSVYTWNSAVSLAAAEEDLQGSTNKPTLLTAGLPIIVGKTAEYTGDENLQFTSFVAKGTPHAFTYSNRSTASTRPVVTQQLRLNAQLVSGISFKGVQYNVVSVGDVVTEGNSQAICPSWNVYAGYTGKSVDSVAIWWAKDVSANTAIGEGKGPILGDVKTVVFCIAPGRNMNVDWGSHASWTADLVPDE